MNKCAHCETEIPTMGQYYQWNGKTFCDLDHVLDWAKSRIESQDKAIAELVEHLEFLVNDIKVAFTWDNTRKLIAKHRPGDSHLTDTQGE